MAIYSNSAFGPPFKNIKRLSTQIEPNYLFGSREYKTDNMLLAVKDVAYASGTATLTVQLESGGGPSLVNGLPAVGAKMGVRGTQTNGGVFNVDPTIVTATTISPATGAGTISFALATDGELTALAIDVAGTLWAVGDQFTIAGGVGGIGQVTAETAGVPSAIEIVAAGDGYTSGTGVATTAILPSVGIGLTVNTTAAAEPISTTADTGTVVVQSAEVPDLVVAGTASAPYALVFTPDESDNSRCLGLQARWSGTLPSAAVVVLQGANIDDDAQYMVIANTQGCSTTGTLASSDVLAAIGSSPATQTGALYSFVGIKFIRAKVLSMTGGDSTTGLIVSCFG